MLISTHQRSLCGTAPKSKARILTVSTRRPALKTWHMLLEAHGYEGVSAVGTRGSEDLCQQGRFDVIILGQSVDEIDKKKLVEAFRKCCSAAIVSIPSSVGAAIDGADIHAEPDPEELLNLIASLVQKK